MGFKLADRFVDLSDTPNLDDFADADHLSWDAANKKLVAIANDMRWQSAADMVSVAATPTAVTTNGSPAWELDDGDGIGGVMIVPHNWLNCSPHMLFYAAAGNAGILDMRLRIRRLTFGVLATASYTYDQAVTTTSHPINLPLPLVFPDIQGAGATFDWRLDRNANTLVDPIRVMGINWEQR